MIFAQKRLEWGLNRRSGEDLTCRAGTAAKSCYAGTSGLVAFRVNTRTDS